MHHLVVFVACCWARNSRKIKRNNGRDPLTNRFFFFFFLQSFCKISSTGQLTEVEVISPVTSILISANKVALLKKKCKFGSLNVFQSK